MKKTKFLFIFILLLFSYSYLFSLADSIKIKITADEANVYLEADENSTIIGKVNKGAVLNLFSNQGGKGKWYYIYYYSEERGLNLSGFVKTSEAEIIGDGKKDREESVVKEVDKKEEGKVSEQEKKQKKVEEISKKGQQTQNIVEKKETMSAKKDGLKIGIGLNLGYAMPTESEFSGGLNYGGNIYLLITRNIGVELSGLNFQSDVSGDPNKLSSGELTVTTLSINIDGRLPVSDLLTPYITVGGSYFMNNFSLDSSIVDSWNVLGFDIKEEVEKGMGFNVGAGLDLSVSNNFLIGIEGRYYINKQEGSWALTDQLSSEKISGNLGKLDMSFVYVGIGIKYLFSL
jgi:opacity protein-like surface antigen